MSTTWNGGAQAAAQANPEIHKRINAAGLDTNYHDHGDGPPVLFVHGSGPGVSAYANWRPVMPALARSRRVLAPDMAGFGYTERKPGTKYELDLWVRQLIEFLDALSIERTDLVGNSFGGAVALATAIRHPSRVRRLVLMGSVGVKFELTPALDEIWGYRPDVQVMRRIMDYFAYDRRLASDELARIRYEASIRPGAQESYASMFPAPRQQWIDALASPEEAIAALPHETLLVHGRDDRVIPMATSLKLLSLIPRSQLHVFSRCGHWTQIEQTARFVELVESFLSEADAEGVVVAGSAHPMEKAQ
ncbi:alpha/beta fold hydrolase [Ramlibacter albus]|uniref:alpha/beta fold hydrolase n=1 Tax=Ramlibacter albus TaxID=2079448 RepID=UPI00338FFBFE